MNPAAFHRIIIFYLKQWTLSHKPYTCRIPSTNANTHSFRVGIESRHLFGLGRFGRCSFQYNVSNHQNLSIPSIIQNLPLRDHKCSPKCEMYKNICIQCVFHMLDRIVFIFMLHVFLMMCYLANACFLEGFSTLQVVFRTLNVFCSVVVVVVRCDMQATCFIFCSGVAIQSSVNLRETSAK